MWNVAICDSDSCYVGMLADKVSLFYIKRGLSVRMHIYRDGYSLISDLERPMDLILLGTKLSDVNGYSVAELICCCSFKRRSLIIFLGEPEDSWISAFYFRPFGYIRRDRWSDDACEVLSRLWVYDHRERSLEVVHQRKRSLLKVSDIMYIEGRGEMLTFWCSCGERYSFKGSMKKYELLLAGYYFVHTSKSFLVNCAYVNGIEEMVCLKNGGSIPCSRSCIGQAKAMWRRYIHEMP